MTTERKYQHFTNVEDGEASVFSPAMMPSLAIDSMDKVPMAKAKTTRVIMNSLVTKQTQESIQHFEQQAGLRDAGYTLHMGLSTEEAEYLRVAEALHKLKVQSGEKQPASAQSAPSSTPTSPRGWFSSGCSTALPGPNLSTLDSGSGIKTGTRQINGDSLDQELSRSLIWEVLPPRLTEEPRSLLQAS